LFDESDPRRDAAQAFASRVRDWVQVAAEADPAPVVPDGKLVVTYHDPCHASRGQDLVDEPRDILRALPNVEFRDMPEADWCCGGAGSYALSHYELSRQVLDRKMENAASTGADLLVTSCPACVVHLSYGVRLRGLPMRVCHLSELIGTPPPSERP
jgi:glycolate oxidase iron-sulfur subunit